MPVRYLIALLLLLSVLLAIVAFHGFERVGEPARSQSCQTLLEQIDWAVQQNDGDPSSSVLDVLGEVDKRFLVCPSGSPEGYNGSTARHYGFVSDDACWQRVDEPPIPLGWDTAARHDGCRNVLFQGGNVLKMKEDEFKVVFERIRAGNIPVYEPVGKRN